MATPEALQPLLEIEGLDVQFLQDELNIHALAGISFTVLRNKFNAIVGESGSGKSVTALAILRLLPHYAQIKGHIFFYDRDGVKKDLLLTNDKDYQQIRGNQISMIFQEPMTSLNPLMKCGKQVMEVLMHHKSHLKDEAKKATLQLFSTVELAEPEKIFESYPHQLSGGQRQRVMIAMALISSPLLLIADEPTTALDVRVQSSIIKLIRKLQQENDLTVLFITHDLGIVSDVADEVVVMHNGKIVESGSAPQVLRAPSQAYTKRLINSRPSAHKPHSRLPENDADEPYALPDEDFVKQTILNENLLTVRNITVEIPDRANHSNKVILNDLSFEVKKGETLGLVGESGCGKTTLGKAIVGLQELSSGSIYIEDDEIDSSTAKGRIELSMQVQMVFQDPYGSLDPRITAGNAIIEPLTVHQIGKDAAERKKIAMNMFRKVKLLPEQFNRYPHEFSGGQRQRICIARALVMNPKLIIFDESVSALDLSVQASILNLISDLKKEYNFSMLFISHDLSVIRHISDRVLVMKGGIIIEEGDPEALFLHPQKVYTQNLIDAIPGKTLR